MHEQKYKKRTQEEHLKSESHAILSYLRASHVISSSVLERQLRKLAGTKEILINPVTQTVRIHYDPTVLSKEEVRSVLKKLIQD